MILWYKLKILKHYLKHDQLPVKSICDHLNLRSDKYRPHNYVKEIFKRSQTDRKDLWFRLVYLLSCYEFPRLSTQELFTSTQRIMLKWEEFTEGSKATGTQIAESLFPNFAALVDEAIVRTAVSRMFMIPCINFLAFLATLSGQKVRNTKSVFQILKVLNP